MTSAAATSRPEDPGAHRGEPFRSCLGPLFLLTFIFFMNFLARIIQAPLMPAIETDLGLSHAEAGSLFLLLSVGYFITLMGSGFVSARLNHRSTIVLSIVCVGATLLATAASTGLWGLRIGIFLVGLTTGLYLPSAIAVITGTVSSRHWGKAIAIHEVAPNLAFVLAPLVAEALLLHHPWRAVLAVLGAGSLAAGAIFHFFGRVGSFAGESPNFRSIGSLARERSYWIMILLFGLGISGSLGIYTMLPLYLVNAHGLTREYANTLLAFSRIPGVAVAFGSGWLTDHIGPKRTIALILLVNGAITVGLGSASTGWLPWLVFMQPAVAVCFFPAGFSAISLTAPPKARNIAVSMITPFGFIIGAGAAPGIIGVFGDLYSLSLGIAVVGVMIAAGAAAACFLHIGQRPESG
jgi:NNP family nitrate/nitrite transporter-like MFS transporter